LIALYETHDRQMQHVLTLSQWHNFKFCPPCRKHHMGACPATSFVKLCLLFLLQQTGHLDSLPHIEGAVVVPLLHVLSCTSMQHLAVIIIMVSSVKHF